jgi:deoxyribonuclease V
LWGYENPGYPFRKNCIFEITALDDKTMNIPDLEQQQTEMSAQVIIPEGQRADFPHPGAVVVTLDVQYAEDGAYVAMDLLHWGAEGTASDGNQIYVCKEEVATAYHPGFFAFREGPVLIAALERLANAKGIHPDLLIIDGHGRAHPRKFGVASWLGLKLSIPAIGVAKETLVRFPDQPDAERGSTSPVTVDGETVGYALRTSTGVKPIFVSPGHLVSLDESRDIALALDSGFRVIEPIRRADQACRAFAKGEPQGGEVL